MANTGKEFQVLGVLFFNVRDIGPEMSIKYDSIYLQEGAEVMITNDIHHRGKLIELPDGHVMRLAVNEHGEVSAVIGKR